MEDAVGRRVVAYLRVSTQEQQASGAGLAAQRLAIEEAAERRGWEIVAVMTDEASSARSMDKRPALARALSKLERGEADLLVVAKLDRLSRSVVDFGTILERCRSRGWGLVALDLGVDTTTPSGELVAHVMAAVAHWERGAIGERTREGLAVKRAQGVRLGRPPALPMDTVSRVLRMADAGLGPSAIAKRLNADKVPTARGGGKWWPSAVAAVLRSNHAQLVKL